MWSLHEFLHGIKWIMFHEHLDYFQKSPLQSRPTTKPLGYHGSLNSHIHWFNLIYHVWGHYMIKKIIEITCFLRAQSPTTSHYTSGSVTTLHDFGGVLGRPLVTFFWALTNSWSKALGLCVKYRSTIAGLCTYKRIFIYFEKIRFASQKMNISIFVF